MALSEREHRRDRAVARLWRVRTGGAGHESEVPPIRVRRRDIECRPEARAIWGAEL